MSIEELKKQKWIKVLDSKGTARHGSNFKYPLPTKTKKGKWLEIGNINLCQIGFHFTIKPENWLCNSPRFFEVEIDFEKPVIFDNSDKICCSRARLVREMDYSELYEYGIYVNYIGGVRRDKKCYVFNSKVVARGNSSVVAWENSSVVARGNSSVVAWGNSSVVAWENSSVFIDNYSSANIDKQKIKDNAQIINRRDKKIYVLKSKFEIVEL